MLNRHLSPSSTDEFDRCNPTSCSRATTFPIKLDIYNSFTSKSEKSTDLLLGLLVYIGWYVDWVLSLQLSNDDHGTGIKYTHSLETS